MNEEARLLLSIWTALSEYIPVGDRKDAGKDLIKVLLDQGNDLELMRDAEDECPYLDKAISEAVEENQEDEIDYDHED